MTQAARRSGQQQQPPQQQPQHDKQRDSGTRLAGRPREAATSYYESLPTLGSDAFMTPIAPPSAPRLSVRKLLLYCLLGACSGALAGAVVLVLVSNPTPQPFAERVGLEPEPIPAQGVASAPEPHALRTIAAQASGSLEQAIARAEAEASPQPAATRAAPEPPPAAAPAPAQRTDAGTRRTARSKAQLADKPTRAEVLGAMTRVHADVRACFPAGHGMAEANVTVLGRTGRVTTAQISGQSGRVGSCIARAVRKARFPKFAAESITIRYPMAL